MAGDIMASTPTGSSIRVEQQGGLAVVSLAQPSRGNPFDGAFTRDFREAFCALWDTPSLRAVLLRADGANFSFGGDLKTFHPERANLGPRVRAMTADLHMGLQRAWHLPVPIVCSVQGYAMGGAVALLAGCDVVLAGASAKFGAAFAQIGFSCDSGSSATLTARMGPARAKRFVLLSEVLTAEQAGVAGLVDQVLPDEKLEAEAMALAQRLADGPTRAFGEIKRLFLKAGSAQLEVQLEDEAHTLARVAGTADAQEGIAAMVERRKPAFRGA
jgi:2-(1,2-epoxy-1,2-dihydrophenyl)acetyl-CoA isomerase